MALTHDSRIKSSRSWSLAAFRPTGVGAHREVEFQKKTDWTRRWVVGGYSPLINSALSSDMVVELVWYVVNVQPEIGRGEDLVVFCFIWSSP